MAAAAVPSLEAAVAAAACKFHSDSTCGEAARSLGASLHLQRVNWSSNAVQVPQRPTSAPRRRRSMPGGMGNDDSPAQLFSANASALAEAIGQRSRRPSLPSLDKHCQIVALPALVTSADRSATADTAGVHLLKNARPASAKKAQDGETEEGQVSDSSTKLCSSKDSAELEALAKVHHCGGASANTTSCKAAETVQCRRNSQGSDRRGSFSTTCTEYQDRPGSANSWSSAKTSMSSSHWHWDSQASTKSPGENVSSPAQISDLSSSSTTTAAVAPTPLAALAPKSPAGGTSAQIASRIADESNVEDPVDRIYQALLSTSRRESLGIAPPSRRSSQSSRRSSHSECQDEQVSPSCPSSPRRPGPPLRKDSFLRVPERRPSIARTLQPSNTSRRASLSENSLCPGLIAPSPPAGQAPETPSRRRANRRFSLPTSPSRSFEETLQKYRTNPAPPTLGSHDEEEETTTSQLEERVEEPPSRAVTRRFSLNLDSALSSLKQAIEVKRHKASSSASSRSSPASPSSRSSTPTSKNGGADKGGNRPPPLGLFNLSMSGRSSRCNSPESPKTLGRERQEEFLKSPNTSPTQTSAAPRDKIDEFIRNVFPLAVIKDGDPLDSPEDDQEDKADASDEDNQPMVDGSLGLAGIIDAEKISPPTRPPPQRTLLDTDDFMERLQAKLEREALFRQQTEPEDVSRSSAQDPQSDADSDAAKSNQAPDGDAVPWPSLVGSPWSCTRDNTPRDCSPWRSNDATPRDRSPRARSVRSEVLSSNSATSRGDEYSPCNSCGHSPRTPGRQSPWATPQEIYQRARSNSAVSDVSLTPSDCDVRPVLSLDRDFKQGETIGAGSFGRVFSARHKGSGHIVAVKEMLLENGKSEKRKGLVRELKLCEQLQHERVVRYFGHEYVPGVQGGMERIHIFLEYCSGGSVASHLRTFGPLEDQLVAKYSSQLLGGLEYLHSSNPPVVHRDLKCANLLLTHDANVKIADFGCSKWLEGRDFSEEEGQHTMVGSVFWTAPEVLRGGAQLTCASDYWSFGCCVLEMATARHPWAEHKFDNMFQAWRMIVSDKLPLVPDGLHNDIKDVIAACLKRVPSERPGAADLKEFRLLRAESFE